MYTLRFRLITENLATRYSGSPVMFRVLKRARRRSWRSYLVIFLLASFVFLQKPACAASARSTYIPYVVSWFGPPDFRSVAFDQVHQQIFTAWSQLDRIDVLSASDYHLIRSILGPLDKFIR